MTVKQTNVPVQVFHIGNKDFECHLDAKHRPLINLEGHSYTDLHKLIEEFPLVLEKKNLSDLAKLANFLFQGPTYQFIDNISAFKEQYLDQIEFEKNSMDYMPSRLIDHGIFDLNGIHAPKVIDGQFVFFVKEDRTGLPYRVSCPYPIPHAVRATYRLLPYA